MNLNWIGKRLNGVRRVPWRTCCAVPVKLHKKSWQNGVVSTIFRHINASPDDIRKAAVADAQRTLESAAHFTRGGGAPAPDHDADYACRSSRVEAEQRRLIQWAKENGKLGSSGRLPPVFIPLIPSSNALRRTLDSFCGMSLTRSTSPAKWPSSKQSCVNHKGDPHNSYFIEDLFSPAHVDLELDCQTIERGAVGSLANLLRDAEKKQ